MNSDGEKIIETTRYISEDEVPPEIREEIRRKEEKHSSFRATTFGKSFGAGLAEMIASSVDKPPDEKVHADTVAKTLGTGHGANVGSLMSAMRPKVNEPDGKQLHERGTTLAAKLVNVAKAGVEREEHARDKAKILVDKILRR